MLIFKCWDYNNLVIYIYSFISNTLNLTWKYKILEQMKKSDNIKMFIKDYNYEWRLYINKCCLKW